MKVELPDNLVPGSTEEAARYDVEAVVLRACRENRITQGKGSEVLGFSFAETERWLARHGIFLPYSANDLGNDLVMLIGITQ